MTSEMNYKLFDAAAGFELERQPIINSLCKQPMTIKQLSRHLCCNESDIIVQLVKLEKDKLIESREYVSGKVYGLTLETRKAFTNNGFGRILDDGSVDFKPFRFSGKEGIHPGDLAEAHEKGYQEGLKKRGTEE